MPVAVFPLGPMGTNSYIINQDSRAVAIDVGGEPDDMLAYLQKEKLELTDICLTHLHFDHLYGVAALAAATGARVLAPRGDESLAKTEIATGGVWGMPPVPPFEMEMIEPGKMTLAGMECDALATPGHTPGSLTYYFPQQNVAFTGDALFYRSMGRTDFPGGNHQQLIKSIHEKLFTLPAATEVFPGHGPATTIADEMQHNPFCGQFAI